MTEMRWKKVESIFHEALSLHGEQRARFLEEACQGDESIRSEVDSLLANYQESDEFLEKGALISEPAGPAFNTGVLLGHYEIIQLLGRGGMGEVYLARDQRLGRKVALKILPPGVAGSIERLRREAQAASALNHPNILTIYDFGQQSELHYIVSEFVDGMHLREKIGNLSRADVLNYARQIGRALEAAHSVGIVHRDIKPENIMVRPDGYIKVLDFGLAKLLNPQSDTGKSLYERLNNSEAATVPGLLIGTINYMSPEQVRGEIADLHTDIWSWGVVLYEMFYWCRPFEAPTPQEVMAAILHKEPRLPVKNSELNRVVRKALSKRAEDRYHSMAEALGDLEQLRAPESGRLFSGWLKSFPLGWTERTLKRTGWIIAIGALLIFGIGGYYLLHHSSTDQASLQGNRASRTNAAQNPQMRVEQVTHREFVTHAALSPREDYVVYSEQRNGREALRVHYLTDDREEEIAHTFKGSYNGITLVKSKDGDVIYYVKGEGERSKLYQFPFGSQHRQLPLILDDDIDSPVSFSPDGSRFVFVRKNRKTKEAALVIRTPESGLETSLPTLKPPEFMYPSPLWSTNGQFVLFDIYGNSTKIRSINVQDATLQEKTLGSFLWQGHASWIEGGQSIAVAAKHYSDNSQLFKVSWPEGIISEIHPDQLDYGDVDSRPESKKIIAIQSDKRSTTIWTGPAAGKLNQVSDIKGKYSGLAWTPSGDLVSETDVGANGPQSDLVIINPRNVEERNHYRQTYDMCEERDPVVSPDGKYLVYASTVRDEVSHRCDGVFHLWRKDLTNKDAFPRRLTSSEGLEYQPVISPDSKTVLYTSVTDSEHLWKISIDGDRPTQLTRATARKADISPDGERIACQYLLEKGWSTTILRMSDGQPIKSLPDIYGGTTARWSADGRHLLYVKTDKGVSNIWSQPLNGGNPTQLTQFKSEQIFAFALSPDRHSLACLHGMKSSDIVLLQPVE